MLKYLPNIILYVVFFIIPYKCRYACRHRSDNVQERHERQILMLIYNVTLLLTLCFVYEFGFLFLRRLKTNAR